MIGPGPFARPWVGRTLKIGLDRRPFVAQTERVLVASDLNTYDPRVPRIPSGMRSVHLAYVCSDRPSTRFGASTLTETLIEHT